jgi:hypothetical protein
MFAWFIGATTLVKAVVIGAAVVVVGGAIAVPTAVITASVVAHDNSAAAPSSMPQSLSTETATPSASPTPTETASASAVPSAQAQVAKAPAAQAAAPAAPDPAPAVQAPAPVDPSVNLPGAPTGVWAFAGGGDVGTFMVNLDMTPPASSGGSAITSYQLGYSLDNGASWKWAPTSAITDGTYHHTGTTYYRATVSDPDYNGTFTPLYCMRAVNSFGAGPRSNISR